MSKAAEKRSGSEGDDYEMVGAGGGVVAVCLLWMKRRRVVYSYYSRCCCRGMLSFCTDVLFLGEDEGRGWVRCWKGGGGSDANLRECSIMG